MPLYAKSFSILWHNEICDLIANSLNEVWSNTSIESGLQSLSGETFKLWPTNIDDDDARVDIRASVFWMTAQEVLFDIRRFHPSTLSYHNKKLPALYKQHENSKKREYSARIKKVEWGVFTPLVLSKPGGMACECTTFYKRLADRLSD